MVVIVLFLLLLLLLLSLIVAPRSIDIANNSSTLYIAYGTPRKVMSMSIASVTEMPGTEVEMLTLGEGYPYLQAIMVDEEQG